jgi:AcrR family transcriptional regulator
MTENTDQLLLDHKQTLLKAAEELFALHGFDGTSIRSIAIKIKDDA